MTHREAKIERQKLDIRYQESLLFEARENLARGYEKLKADFEREYTKLKQDVARAEIALDRQKVYLNELETNLTDSFGDM